MTNNAEHELIVSEILSRGVGEYFDPNDEFRNKLLGKLAGTYTEDIVIKFGVDPTRPDIHLGHAVVLRKLRAMQDIGCKIIFLIGDFTSQIGDPTGKSKVRPEISQAEIENNLKTYLDQVGKILRVERDQSGNILHTPTFSWMRNSDWFVGVTDIATDPNANVAINIGEEGKQGTAHIPANSFIGKAAVFEGTRMQRSQLHKQEVVGITLINFLSVLRRITHAQLIERDMFQDRLKSGESLYMHEMMYPVIQGLDSVMLARIYGSCDLEIGGTDQTFNMLMGRRTMEMSEIKPQAVMSVELLVGTDGKEKMSKSLNNYIAVNDSPREIYGKVMSLPDHVMETYFKLSTYTRQDEIEAMQKGISSGTTHPRDMKMSLAKQIVSMYHGEGVAEKAEQEFVETFQKRGIPEDIQSVTIDQDTSLVDVLTQNLVVPSKSEFRRLIEAGAIRIDGETKIEDPNLIVKETTVFKIGKYQFIKVIHT